MKPVVVVVPLHKTVLDPLEHFSLAYSLHVLRQRDRLLIGPNGLDLGFYQGQYGDIPFIDFGPECFASIQGYNRLLLNPEFYLRFAEYEFVLILQPDAIVLRDELDEWCARPFDYVGAPWPDGYELFVNVGRFEGNKGKRVKVPVGNGGLSLRRVAKSIALLREFDDDTLSLFLRTGSSEDLFFSVMGALSEDFIIPNEMTAARFSLELKPSYYLAVNGGRMPMGGHAWWKYEPELWRRILRLDDQPPSA
jgi:hypothetical protein